MDRHDERRLLPVHGHEVEVGDHVCFLDPLSLLLRTRLRVLLRFYRLQPYNLSFAKGMLDICVAVMILVLEQELVVEGSSVAKRPLVLLLVPQLPRQLPLLLYHLLPLPILHFEVLNNLRVLGLVLDGLQSLHWPSSLRQLVVVLLVVVDFLALHLRRLFQLGGGG